jgi:6-pyruvoyltetrahydropterin/6-carboxytetrahydropterin synthase
MLVSFLTVDVVFAAAHRLASDTPDCRGLHGHSYRLRVTARRSDGGAASDSAALRALVQERVWTPLDHSLLNDTLEDPTAERVADWIWRTLAPAAPTIVEVSLAESRDRQVTLREVG